MRRVVGVSFLFVLCIFTDTWAQSRLYIVPLIGDGSVADRWRPKYITMKPGECTKSSQMKYDYMPIFIVAAECSPEHELFISSQPDVFTFPKDLDAKLTDLTLEVAASAMEFHNVPADGLNTANTWRDAARRIAGVFAYMARLKAIIGDKVIFDSTINLSSKVNQIDSTLQAEMESAALSLGWNMGGGLRNNSTLREILTHLSNQWGSVAFRLNDVIL